MVRREKVNEESQKHELWEIKRFLLNHKKGMNKGTLKLERDVKIMMNELRSDRNCKTKPQES